jgi:integrase
MGKIRVRKESGNLQFDFFYKGMRCREQTLLEDNPGNRQRLEVFMEKIDREIKQGTFEYEKYFPNSKKLNPATVAGLTERTRPSVSKSGTPLFNDFVEEWYMECEVTWKISYQKTVRGNIEKHLKPVFGEEEVSHITKGDILKFRSSLAKVPNGKKVLSPSRINHIMTTLRMILNDAAERFHFSTPFVGIKPLKVPPTDVDPFTIKEINLFLSRIRADFLNYYTVRFFSALRTGEVDGLQWQYVDFDRRLILIRETLVEGRIETPKTSGSIREVYMSGPVLEAMKKQREITGPLGKFVFCNRTGEALDHRNVTKRIWYPMLKLLKLKERRPYQTRHTTATLWLAAGENPEWIARQMGHTSTEMLFTVYSRYVPNLTRNDGSAFESLLCSRMNGGSHDE